MLAGNRTSGSGDVLVLSHRLSARGKGPAPAGRAWGCWRAVPPLGGDPVGAKPTLLFAVENGPQLSWITVNFAVRK